MTLLPESNEEVCDYSGHCWHGRFAVAGMDIQYCCDCGEERLYDCD